MKKFTLTVMIALFIVGGAKAQLGYGLKAGLNFPSYNIENSDSETNSTTNFYVTGYLDAPVANNVFIQPGVSLQGKGAKLMSASWGNENAEITQNTMWLEIPVNVVGKFDAGMGKVFLGAGPYASFGLSGKNKFSSSVTDDYQEDFKFGKDNTLKGTDFGLNFLAGYEFENGIHIHGGYGLGLTNIAGKQIEKSTGDIKNRVWSVGIGFSM